MNDNPKELYGKNGKLLGILLENILEMNGISPEDLWEDKEKYLWFARLYPVCNSMQEAMESCRILYRMIQGQASKEEIDF